MAFASGVNTTSPAIRATLPWAGIARRCQRQVVTIDVGIVRYKNGTRHGQWMVLERRESVMDTIGSVVNRCDVWGGQPRGCRCAVRHVKAECHRTMEIGVWCVGPSVIAVVYDISSCDVKADNRQRVANYVRGVGDRGRRSEPAAARQQPSNSSVSCLGPALCKRIL